MMMHGKPGILEEDIYRCLREHYDLMPATLEPLAQGLDMVASVYRVMDHHKASYLLKVRSGPFYKPACLIPAYLKEQGIVSVVAPLPTKRKALWVQIGAWTITLYLFLDGETSWNGITGEHWKKVGAIFRQIHSVVIPASDFVSLRKETFDPTLYIDRVHEIETHMVNVEAGSVIEQELHSSWVAHQSTIQEVTTVLARLAKVLQKRIVPYVICHADLHPANLLRDRTGQLFVIDWDEVMLAPKERDFIFVQNISTDGLVDVDHTPFFQGYREGREDGQIDIDWIALTYYRYERVVQDLIECAQTVFFRENLEEKDRADSLQLFQDILRENSELTTARATAALVLDLDL